MATINDEHLRRMLCGDRQPATTPSPPPAGYVWAYLQHRLRYRRRRPRIDLWQSAAAPASAFCLAIATFAVADVPPGAIACVALVVPAAVIAGWIGSVRFS